jgi:hypothetical protein
MATARVAGERITTQLKELSLARVLEISQTSVPGTGRKYLKCGRLRLAGRAANRKLRQMFHEIADLAQMPWG